MDGTGLRQVVKYPRPEADDEWGVAIYMGFRQGECRVQGETLIPRCTCESEFGLEIEKKIKKVVRWVGVINTQLNSEVKIFFKRSATRVAMVAIVATDQKSPKVPC